MNFCASYLEQVAADFLSFIKDLIFLFPFIDCSWKYLDNVLYG